MKFDLKYISRSRYMKSRVILLNGREILSKDPSFDFGCQEFVCKVNAFLRDQRQNLKYPCTCLVTSVYLPGVTEWGGHGMLEITKKKGEFLTRLLCRVCPRENTCYSNTSYTEDLFCESCHKGGEAVDEILRCLVEQTYIIRQYKEIVIGRMSSGPDGSKQSCLEWAVGYQKHLEEGAVASSIHRGSVYVVRSLVLCLFQARIPALPAHAIIVALFGESVANAMRFFSTQTSGRSKSRLGLQALIEDAYHDFRQVCLKKLQ